MFAAKLIISTRKENFASVLDLPGGGGQVGAAAAQRRHQLRDEAQFRLSARRALGPSKPGKKSMNISQIVVSKCIM